MVRPPEISAPALVTDPLRPCRWRATHAGDALDRSMRAERDGIGRRAAYRCMDAVRPFEYHIRLPWLQLFLAAIAAHYLYSTIHASYRFANYGAVRHRAFRLVPPTPRPAHLGTLYSEGPGPGSSPPPGPSVRVTVRLLRRGCQTLAHTFDAHDSAPLTLREPLTFDGVELQVRRRRTVPPPTAAKACISA